MAQYSFDDSKIQWRQLGDFEHFRYDILDIDENNNVIDVVFKFDPHKQIVLHRHKVLNKTFVIHGEHRFFESDGRLKESSAVGSFTTRPADTDPHRECGGDDGAIVLFSVRVGNLDADAPLYEILDDNNQLIGTLSKKDFIQLYQQKTMN